MLDPLKHDALTNNHYHPTYPQNQVFYIAKSNERVLSHLANAKINVIFHTTEVAQVNHIIKFIILPIKLSPSIRNVYS